MYSGPVTVPEEFNLHVSGRWNKPFQIDCAVVDNKQLTTTRKYPAMKTYAECDLRTREYAGYQATEIEFRELREVPVEVIVRS